ncbi:MAG TPA: MgtC/SapB family protein [Gammaproteobacteria bacterium]|nr:MgtC/SapB family protein [Gammaproteobacteria bacterium]
MPEDWIQIIVPLGSAWLAGSLIGLERSYHGRPAGFRTHALVCIASALLMLATVHQSEWTEGLPVEAITTDPTRMAQGIMTGIGFLGAGVIIQEGLTVHGLTTAASIWITSALGIMFGVGYYLPAIITTLIVLIVLSFFRWVEARLPTQLVLQHVLRFERSRLMSEREVRDMLEAQGFEVSKFGFSLSPDRACFEYSMLISTLNGDNVERLSDVLRGTPGVVSFRLVPLGTGN